MESHTPDDPSPAALQPMEADRRAPRTYCNPMNLDYGYSPSVSARTPDSDTPFVRQLIVEHEPDVNEEVLQTIVTADKTSFPSLAKILEEWVSGHLHVATSEKRMDCAELLALTYQRMGLLPSEPPPNAYTPRDFSAQHMNLRFLRGATLGPQLEVLWAGAGPRASHDSKRGESLA